MLYSYFVKKLIRQSFDHVNNHRWDALLKAGAPRVHHRFAGAHALGGERHDKEALRRWFERLGRVLPNLHIKVNNIWVNGWPGHTTVFAQWDGTATLLNGTSYVNRGLHVFTCGGAESMHSRNFKIHKQRPVLSPPKRLLASKKLPPNKL